MYTFSRVIERYDVHYTDPENGTLRTRKFKAPERAIDFAREKMNSGVDADIQEIVNLEGWY